MRRDDRAQDRDFSLALIDRCTHGVMALSTGEPLPYCLPLSFVRIGEDLFFHCAREGRTGNRWYTWQGPRRQAGHPLRR